MLCFTQVERHDRRRQTLWYAILDRYCLINCFEFHQVQNRSEGLMLYDLKTRLSLCNARFHITTAFISFSFKHAAFNNKFSALFNAFLNGGLVLLYSAFIDKWSDVIIFI